MPGLNQSRQGRVASEQVVSPDKVQYFTNALATLLQPITMNIRQTTLIITMTDASTGTAVCSLPSVAEAAGLTFTIIGADVAGGITLTDFGGTSFNDSVDWDGDYTIDTNDDKITLMSDGRRWIVLDNGIA